jgi:glycosyltransferase involved in cell wall biosynthesis
MACGAPVVATGAGGSAEYLADGENCLLFAPSDPDELAGALRRLAADRELRRRLVAAGLETAARLTVDRQADALEAVHLSVARG